MITEHGVAMFHGMKGAAGGYWSRSSDGRDVVQHSFWLFDTEENARTAEATFNTLRDMPEAPATFISVDVCANTCHATPASETTPRPIDTIAPELNGRPRQTLGWKTPSQALDQAML